MQCKARKFDASTSTVAQLAPQVDESLRIRGDDPTEDNTTRAHQGAAALLSYALGPGSGSEPVETSLADVLGSLMHTADALGIDFHSALNRAEICYQDEVSGTL
ncbi:Uncharacterised protein [Mycobacteroides abscessus subsp. abscessus]|jgi:hypothetical protein|nr:Uncharacterised protein [Mycobacteroides abscessus subsp. abscessus]